MAGGKEGGGRWEVGGGCGVVHREKQMAFTRGGLCGYKLYFECRLPQMGGVWWPSWYLPFEILLIKEKGEGTNVQVHGRVRRFL